MDYSINNITSLELKANFEIIREVLSDPVHQLPQLLPEIYKRMSVVQDNPPTYAVEYTDGCPINIDVVEVYDPIVTPETMKATYEEVAGSLLDYYKSFKYTVLFTSLSTGGTSVKITYDFVKDEGHLAPAIFEFYANNLIKLDQVLITK